MVVLKLIAKYLNFNNKCFIAYYECVCEISSPQTLLYRTIGVIFIQSRP